MAHAEPDQELCQRYAQFASHMVRWQFKVIYWTMFITNLFVLFIASWIFIKGQDATEKLKNDKQKRKKKLQIYMAGCFVCILVSTTIVVMEVYALMALQFCDGEDLISLYWSTWTMIQVGSLIAMVGIILAMIHSMNDTKHPPWALALGTPVLVIAGFLHLFHHETGRKITQLRRASSTSAAIDPNLGPPISQANTIQVSDEDAEKGPTECEYIGMTVEGGPIVRFSRAIPNSALSRTMTLLGHDGENRPIVAYSRDSVKFHSDVDNRARQMSTASTGSTQTGRPSRS